MRALAGISLLLLCAITLAAGDSNEPTQREGKPTSQPTSQSVPRRVKIGEITREMVGQVVSVRGTVQSVMDRPSKTRERIYIVTLADGDCRIQLVYWADVAKKIPPEQAPVEKDRIRVTGKVTEYRNRLEIVLNDAGDIRKLKPKAD